MVKVVQKQKEMVMSKVRLGLRERVDAAWLWFVAESPIVAEFTDETTWKMGYLAGIVDGKVDGRHYDGYCAEQYLLNVGKERMVVVK